MTGFFFFKFVFIVVLASCALFSAPLSAQTTQPSTQPSTQPAELDPRMVIATKRIAYIQDGDVVRLGLRQIERFLKTEYFEQLSQYLDLLQALLSVMKSTKDTAPEIDEGMRQQAGSILGRAKLVPLGETELIETLENEATRAYAEAALIAYAETHKLHPPASHVESLLNQDRIDTLHSIAKGSSELSLINYLRDEAFSRKRPELLYGLNNKAVADLAAGDFLTQTVACKTPMIRSVARASSKKILIEWSDESLNEDGFIVERSSDNRSFTEAIRAKNNQIAIFSDAPDEPGVYWYRVRCFNKVDASEPSESLSIDTTPPSTQSSTQPTELPSTQPAEPATQPSEEASPDPEPEPVLPESPPSRPEWQDLVNQLLFYVEGEPHHATALALVSVIAESRHYESAAKAAEYLAKRFSRDAYDFDARMTSYGLRAVRESRRRARRAAEDYELPSNAARKQYEVRFNEAAKTMNATFEDK